MRAYPTVWCTHGDPAHTSLLCVRSGPCVCVCAIVLQGCYFFSLFALMWSLVFMGYGCQFPDDAYITATVGAVGIVVILAGWSNNVPLPALACSVLWSRLTCPLSLSPPRSSPSALAPPSNTVSRPVSCAHGTVLVGSWIAISLTFPPGPSDDPGRQGLQGGHRDARHTQ
jgi:hypothetical protein